MTNPLSFLAPLAKSTYIKEDTQNFASSNLGITTVNFNDIDKDTQVHGAALKKANQTRNESALSIMLKDYSEMCEFSSNSSKSTSIPKEKMTNYSLTERISAKFKGETLDNIFRNDNLKEHVQGCFTRKDIYQQELIALEKEWVNSQYQYDPDLKRGARLAESYYKDVPTKDVNNGLGIGLRYADENDDIYEAALNLAQADIASIEQAYSLTEDGKNTIIDGTLDAKELDSPNTYRNEKDAFNAILALDLDNDRQLSAQEYATYIVASDLNQDGILSSKEIEWVNEHFSEFMDEIRQEKSKSV